MLSRTLLTMCTFSVVCLVYVGLFPSVRGRNFGMDVDDAGYKLLYTTWGVGACLGALAVGTVLAPVDRRRLVVDGLLLFAVSLAVFAVVRSPGPAFPVAFVLGFAYFLTATALITIFQENLADTERAVVMPLWFMAFGGSVPDRQRDLRPRHRRHRRPLGARCSAPSSPWRWPAGATSAACRNRRSCPPGVPHDARPTPVARSPATASSPGAVSRQARPGRGRRRPGRARRPGCP